MFRRAGGKVEVFLAHMGGPFWARKDDASWSIPKGEFEDDEVPLDAAKREFREETGLIPTGRFIELAPVKQSGGKTIFAWAVEWDCDAIQRAGESGRSPSGAARAANSRRGNLRA